MTFVLTAKPRVRSALRNRWRVDIEHTAGIHTEYWRNHLTALNCALAIARTSNWLPGEDWSPEGTMSDLIEGTTS